MKSFEERNPLIIGGIGAALIVVIVIAALQYNKLPFINSDRSYSAYFADAGGLEPGDAVQYSGLRVGQVDGVDLDGPRVLVRFGVRNDVRLGDRTEAAIKARAALGDKILELTSRGTETLDGPIPLDRTTSPYQLPDALGDLSTTIGDLDTGQLSTSLATLADTFRDTPPELHQAIDGVARFAATLNKRDEQLRNLLANANKVTSVLAERSDDVVRLVADANALLMQLRAQSASLDQVSSSVSALSRQLKGFIADNRHNFKPALDKLNGVLAVVDNRKERIQQAIKYLNNYAMSLGESVASGPFFKAYVANLLPGQFIQPFVDAAFSDLGLDPNVLLPSQRTDPQVGQPGTPALPVPYPRTGQGGEPNLNLPDAITGNPGDPRYPYREPLPAPPPGGPPPGPPAEAPPEIASTPTPTPSPVFSPAPGEPNTQEGQP
ncbi:MCE family protein [Mycobacterium sp. CVI_P3]|uniref:MCE family protein n=1 Tax=Mycobacterium pinniadriaticum TaxID=2994102 RepID=A0ABT3SBD3_9MYCO|nr:MCE family protein [Mycobacterium pinniadriaticum]MCX2929892.1 MCE family protein [Mycobacterium pinniadriaticum]MCX2936459.1 MCE family protein [Mycobacterium pinniadriaticum]